MRLTEYATFVFDCDGVILNSNAVKTEAFRRAALPYGEDAAEALVAHHVANGGVSRYAKFAHFLSDIVVPGTPGPALDELLDRFAKAVRQGLMTCEVAAGLEDLRVATGDARWMIVSGGDQAELRDIFAARGLASLFDAGIFGSPDTKITILAREVAAGNIRVPAVFLGDSRYDHEAAVANGLDFAFLSRWSEFRGWRDYTAAKGLAVYATLDDLLADARPTPSNALSK